MNFWGYLLLPFIVLNNFSSSFRIIEMKESVSVFNATPTVATVKNFDLSSYSDVTMCIREGFKKKIKKKSDNYHFRGGGGQRGPFFLFFFGLKMIFKQF